MENPDGIFFISVYFKCHIIPDIFLILSELLTLYSIYESQTRKIALYRHGVPLNILRANSLTVSLHPSKTQVNAIMSRQQVCNISFQVVIYFLRNVNLLKLHHKVYL